MRFRFGNFVLDSRTGTVTGPDGPVPLRRQTFHLLEVLLRRSPELLDRNTLLDEAWGRTALSPNVLPQAISELRNALGDNPHKPNCIETVHRRGYRIICPVEQLDAGSSGTDAQGSDPAPASAPSASSKSRTRLQMAALAAAVLALVAVTGLWWHQESERSWLYEQALPEIRDLLEVDLTTAWRRAREVRERVGINPQLDQVWLNLGLPVTLTSEPPGAAVHVRGYREADLEWIDLGTTPIEDIQLPLAMLRFRVSLDGHATLETAPSVLPVPEPFHLIESDRAREDMVYVPPGPVNYALENRHLPGFWIDRFEITNREFRNFIDEGGYQRTEFWRHPVMEGGRELGHEELQERLVDTTGMPGPATWAMGTYPQGEADHPVEGVSWYEAAAYAEYAGKQLPTVFHWYRAAGLGTAQLQNFSDILMVSNFNSRGTVAVGTLDGLGAYGTYDMAGNVAEWCANRAGALRHILGGSWMEDRYRFRDPEAQRPLERRPGFGFRLMFQEQPIDAELRAEVALRDYAIPDPVDDATFEIYARQFDYDPMPLEARVDEIDESHDDWRREWVSFNAGYSGERVVAQVLLPRNATPPYQTIINYPGGDALLLDSSRKAGLYHVESFLRSGRAVVYPVYLGTFERKSSDAGGPVSWRNLLIHQVKDMRRTIDYLETRGDIDTDRLALHGVSYGGFRAPYALAVEDRFRAAIMLSAGVVPITRIPPEVQLQDYLPRVTLPVLLVNGRDDFNFPYESSQRPFFELLGTPAEHKRHVVLDWGHLPPHYTDVIRANLDWFDRWLGTVD